MVRNAAGFLPTRWSYTPGISPRDLRLDFLRGMCLVVMLIDHFQKSWMVHYTIQSLGSISAAEGFVFISGMVVCRVYLPFLEKKGFRLTARKAAQRALKLYLAYIVLLTSLILLDQIPFINIHLNRLATYSSKLALGIDILLLRYRPSGFHVLPLYVMLLIATPGILWLIHKKHTWWLVLGSVTLYVLYHLAPKSFTWELGRAKIPLFPFMTWQLLYIAGILTMHYRRQFAAWWKKCPREIFDLGILIFFVFFFVLHHLLEAQAFPNSAALDNFWFSKRMLNVGRLLNFAVAGILFHRIIDRCWKPLAIFPGALFIPLGQASLWVFLMQVVLLYLYRAFPRAALSFTGTGIYEMISIALLYIMVKQRFLFRIIRTERTLSFRFHETPGRAAQKFAVRSHKNEAAA